VSDEPTILDTVKTFVGSSVGALIVTLVSIGFTPLEILLTCFTICPVTLLNHKANMRRMLDTFIGELTFAEHHTLTGNTLIIPTYDLYTQSEVFYSHASTPEKKIVDALMETTSIVPGGTTMDGCLCQPFPIKYCRDHGHTPILGIYCDIDGVYCNVPPPSGDTAVELLQQEFSLARGMRMIEDFTNILKSVRFYFSFVQSKFIKYELHYKTEEDRIICYTFDSSEDINSIDTNTVMFLFTKHMQPSTTQ